MAAVTAVFQSLLPGDHVLVSRVLYWGVRKWLAEFALTWGLDVEFSDTADLGAVAAAIRPGRTRLLWLETPANPMWEVTDLAAACELAHAAGGIRSRPGRWTAGSAACCPSGWPEGPPSARGAARGPGI